MRQIVARVISQKGNCEAGHTVGDEFIIGLTTPPGLCCGALHTIYPLAGVLQLGGSFSWEKDPHKTTVFCPDPNNPVLFELKLKD